MDLSVLFQDSRVERGTHVVMKSVGVPTGGQYTGFQIFPKFDENQDPAHEIFPKARIKQMEQNGWQLVKQVAEPTDAAETPKRKARNVEG